jgi:hypothetical protein
VTKGRLLVVHERRDGQSSFGAIDLEGNLVIALDSRELLAAYPEGYLIVRDRGKQGVMDFDGNWVIQPNYDTVELLLGEDFEWSGRLCRTETYASGEGDLNRCQILTLDSGESLSGLELSTCGIPKPLLFPVGTVASAGLQGYMSGHWSMTIPEQFRSASLFQEGRARVQVGVELAEQICASARLGTSDDEVFAACEAFDASASIGWGFIDEEGHLISRFDYQSVESFSQGRALVMRDGLRGYLDPAGKELIPLQFARASSFSDGLALVSTGDGEQSMSFIDRDGQTRLKDLCTAEPFSEGLAFVSPSCETEQGMGYVDVEGRLVIPGLGPGRFIAGQAWVRDPVAQGYGLINTHGAWMSAFRLRDEPGRQLDGVSFFTIPAGVIPGDPYDKGFVNLQGELIWPPGWSDPCQMNELIIWPNESSCRLGALPFSPNSSSRLEEPAL